MAPDDGFGKQWFDHSSGGTSVEAETIMDLGQRIKGQALLANDDAYLWKRNGILTTADAGGVAAQDVAAQALIDVLVASSRGAILKPARGETRINKLTIPENRALVIEGYGTGWRSTAGVGSRLKRHVAGSTADALLACAGSGLTDTTRALAGLRRIMLHGGRDSGFLNQAPLVLFNRWQQGVIDDIYLFENDGPGLALGNIFNCHIDRVNITHCGSPTLDSFGHVQAALHVAGAGTDGSVRFLANNWHVEQSFATDVRLGNPDNAGGYVTEFVINGLSMEGGLDSSGVPNPIPYPYLHLGFAESGAINGLYIFCHRSVPPILVEHPAGGGAGADDAVKINGVGITQSSTTADPDYFIDVQGGSLHLSNFYIRGKPNVAYVRIGADVRPGAVVIGSGCQMITRDGSVPPVLVQDNRAVKEFF